MLIDTWLMGQPSAVKARVKELALRCKDKPYSVMKFFVGKIEGITYEDVEAWLYTQPVPVESQETNSPLRNALGVDSYAAMCRGLMVSLKLLEKYNTLLDEEPYQGDEEESKMSTALVFLSQSLPSLMREIRGISSAIEKTKAKRTLTDGIMIGVNRARSLHMNHALIRDKACEGEQLSIWDATMVRVAEDLELMP